MNKISNQTKTWMLNLAKSNSRFGKIAGWLPPIYGLGPLHYQIWWVRPHRISKVVGPSTHLPPPPWRRPWLGTCRGNQLLFVKTPHANTTICRRNELYFVKTRFVRQHQRKSLFTPTSAKISTNQWYYFLSFIGRIAQTHRTQNSSNTNFSHLVFFFLLTKLTAPRWSWWLYSLGFGWPTHALQGHI